MIRASALSLCLFLVGFGSCVRHDAKTIVIKNDIDSISHYTGIFTAWNLRDAGYKRFNTEAFFTGLDNSMDTSRTQASFQEANYHIGKLLDRFRKRQNEKNLLEGRAYLEKNKSRREIIVTGSGLQYEPVIEGKGKKPEEDDSLSIHFTGLLIDGTEFISTRPDNPQIISLHAPNEIKGLPEALRLMRVGSRYKFYLPAELAFGESPPSLKGLKPNMPVIFEIELLSSIPGKKKR